MKHWRCTKLFFVLMFILVACALNFGGLLIQDIQPEELVDSSFQVLSDLLDNPQNILANRHYSFTTEVDKVFRNLFDFEAISAKVIDKYRNKFNEFEKTVFLQAFEESLKKQSIEQYNLIKGNGFVKKRLVHREMKQARAELTYSLIGGNKTLRCRIQLSRNNPEGWKIRDVKIGKFRLTEYYKKFIHNILKKYSFPVLVAELKQENFIIVDDFSDKEIGEFPEDWKWLPKDERDEKLYEIKSENGNKYLNVRDRGDSVLYGQDFRWNIRKYPYISWRWRIHALPKGGDERFNETNDSAAAVYVIYGKNFAGVPKVVKYVWSTTLPVGTATRRKGIGRPWTVVAKSGEAKSGEWHTEIFNAVDAYKQVFGGNPPENALGIAILTDANSTGTYAEADYDDIKLFQRAEAESGIKKFLAAGK